MAVTGFIGSGKVAIVRTDTTKASTASLTTYTFSSVVLPGGFTVVAIGWLHGSANRTLNSVTIGGVAATRAVRAAATGVGNAELWYAQVPSSNNGEIVLVFSAAMILCAVIPYKFIGVRSATPNDTDTLSLGASPTSSTSIDVPKFGGALSVIYTNQAVTFSWGGLAEDIDTHPGIGTISTAFSVFDTAQTALAVTATETGSSAKWHATASWR